MNASPSIVLFAPAKLNLFLAVTGRRSDGFHDLVSLVAPLDWGDELRVAALPANAEADTLGCASAEVPLDGTNLVLRAAAAWRAAGGRAPFARFELVKHTPAGAGLGGGSSDAVAALRGLQGLAANRVAEKTLAGVAAQLGSDCPLFFADGPVVVRGRGERIEALGGAERARLAGQRVLVCKPGFGVETPWAYGRLIATAPSGYTPVREAEARLAAWCEGRSDLEALIANSFEPVVFGKFPALPALAERLRRRCGLALHLTGSGSACFALLADAGAVPAALAEVREAWGPGAFAVATTLR